MTDVKNLKKRANLSLKQNLISTSGANSDSPDSLISHESFTSSTSGFKDRFVLSKGQDSPLLYSLFSFSGVFTLEKTKIQRNFRSHNEGHQDIKFEILDGEKETVGGNALSIGAGLALEDNRANRGNKIYVLLSGDELEKGSVWEGANFASYHKLGNLIAILDINHVSRSASSFYGFQSDEYEKRFRAFGFEAFTIDEDLNDIDISFHIAHQSRFKPVAIIVNTLKGKETSSIENKNTGQDKKSDADKLWKSPKELDLV